MNKAVREIGLKRYGFDNLDLSKALHSIYGIMFLYYGRQGMKYTENLILRVSPELKKLVFKNAENQGISPSEMVRGLLLTAFVEGNEDVLLKKYLLEKAKLLTVEGKQLMSNKKSAEFAKAYNEFSKIRTDTLNLLAKGKGIKALNDYSKVFRIFSEIEEILRE